MFTGAFPPLNAPDYSSLLRADLAALPVYQPGRPVELVAREFGLDPASVTKLASNENPLGSSPLALEAARGALKDAWLYPDNAAWFLSGALAKHLGMERECLTLGAGSNEIFYLLAHCFLGAGKEAVMGEYAFIAYRIATLLAGGRIVSVPMPGLRHDLDAMLDAVTDRTRLVFLPNPNNPTGTLLAADEVVAFARSLPDHVILCYDEAYAEYQENPCDLRPLIAEGRRIVCTRTFSKIYGLAGLRVGYAYSDAALAAALNSVRPPFNTGNVAQAAARAALDDTDWVRRSRQVNDCGLCYLEGEFDRLGIAWTPSAGNFILAEFADAAALHDALQRSGVIVRPVASYGLPGHLRISVGTEEQNRRLVGLLEKWRKA